MTKSPMRYYGKNPPKIKNSYVLAFIGREAHRVNSLLVRKEARKYVRSRGYRGRYCSRRRIRELIGFVK